MRIGIAADHAGLPMKQQLADRLREAGYTVVDYGAASLRPDDDYPDYVIPLARAVAGGNVERGIALCGSGVGASIAANKVAGARAFVVPHRGPVPLARIGVEDEDANLLCLGARRLDSEAAWELALEFLQSSRVAGDHRTESSCRQCGWRDRR